MHIQKITVQNFRLLENVELSLEKRTTVIVGRNNSGKTSLTELFRRLLTDKTPHFRLEDFSLSAHENFWRAYEQLQAGEEENKVREMLPAIEISLSVNYADNATSYGPLSEFIIDLNTDCTETLIKVRHELEKGKLHALFEDIDLNEDVPVEEQKTAFFKAIKDRVPRLYTARIYAEDPNDATNQKDLEASKLHTLLQSGFINAQRGLDDATRKDGVDQKKSNVLGSILEQLFSTASNSDNEQDQEIITNLETAIHGIQQGIDEGFNAQLTNLLPTFSMFGYPGLSDPNLRTETTLDVERLLKNHTKVHYAGVNGINLPEAYNGLGTRNLIYILLQLLEFYKSFTAKDSTPGMNLIFIEEPEAHLHPQMQEVFIAKLGEIAESFARTFGDRAAWPVQFVVTTHSPHMANKARFESMRYFLTHPQEGAENIRTTEIKDLNKGLADTPKPDKEFLHKYMVLTGCDLLFADKIVLIEGATERIMLPALIEKIDAASEANAPKLSSQYVSVMEVGGAHAHKFFDLLNFLDLSTLIITDLDSVDGNSEVCEVSAGASTSNSCIKAWFSTDVTPAELIAKTDHEKTKKRTRLCYQVPEQDGGGCGRSFEDAFILANHVAFELATVDAAEAYKKAKKIKKTNFAIEYGINNTNWNVPLYIAQGLRWLAASDILPLQKNQNEADREAA
ncbi:MAG: ATP-dependent endonuclease [Micavibrio sp.]|nr:ATP-dependent endonuclease [Micavibrio sp.]|tara:strand:+ start:2168 stop:4207 length:2040 start_codon:yes stop_codon:yes gene_type:complete